VCEKFTVEGVILTFDGCKCGGRAGENALRVGEKPSSWVKNDVLRVRER